MLQEFLTFKKVRNKIWFIHRSKDSWGFRQDLVKDILHTLCSGIILKRSVISVEGFWYGVSGG
jgi:hypothetical protein